MKITITSFTRIASLFILLFSLSNVRGQGLKEQLADGYFDELNYPKAVSIYEDIAVAGKASPAVYRKMALTYRKLGNMEKAEDSYARLMNDGIESPPDLLTYADILRRNGKYEEALKWYADYNELVPGDRRATQYINNPGLFIDLLSDSASTIRTLNINSSEADLGLAYMDDLLVFSSARGDGPGGGTPYQWDKQPFLNLYTAILEGQTVKEPLVMRKEINSRYHDGTVSFDSIAQRMYFTRNNFHYGVITRSEDKELKLGIYFTDIQMGQYGKEWTPLIPFDHNNPEYNYGHPCVSPDGRMLFFVSDMKGGYGGTDIYKCDNLGSAWGVPQNLGPGINTSGNEMYPYFSADSILYFASDGHPGLGGLDLFLAPSAERKFGNAFNLGAPVNTRYNDHGVLLLDTKNGFMVSDRPGGAGDDDIYGVTLARPMIHIRGMVVDKVTRMPIDGATILLKDGEGNKVERVELETGPEGRFTLRAEFHNSYKLIGVKNGYFQKEIELQTATSDLDSVLVELLKYDYGAEGIVSQGETGLPLDGATVMLMDANDSLVMSITTDETGKYVFPLEPESDYRVRVEKEGYFRQSARISTKGKSSGVMYADFSLFELEMDKVVRLDNIYYEYAKWNITKEAEVELDKLVQTMWDNPTVKLELSAHTDCRGGDAYNMTLSKKRAKSVVDYMVSKGIPSDRLISKGYGETDPVESCECKQCTEEQHQINRRTQFKVLDF
jgi:outer membrane protein OmpA-like peptidoglycan-associated protein